MIILRSIHSLHFHTPSRFQNPSSYFKNPPRNPHCFALLISSDTCKFSFLSSISQRPFSLSAYLLQTSERDNPKSEKSPASALFTQTSEENNPKSRKRLSVFFKEAVWISEKSECGEVKAETGYENAGLKEKLRNLAEEVDSLDKTRLEKGEILNPPSKNHEGNMPSGDKRRLFEIFANKKMNKEVKLEPIDLGNEDSKVYKLLSSDMQIFAYHLYTGGYLKNANFMPKDKFDLTGFEASYARDYLKRAAFEFGIDHQEIAKWLSASDLKTIAIFGCPSLGEKSVKAAKHLRSYFKIDEQQVCKKCILKESCKLANKKSRKDSSKLRLGDVNRVLVMYAMDSVPRQLVVPEEIKNSVSRLLKEVINLSDTVSKRLSKTPDLQ